MDCSLPGSSVHGIFQARVLEWGAIAFSVNQLTTNFTFILNSTLSHMLLGGDNYRTGLNWKMSFVSPSL